jgi:hypothetical protein
VSLDDDLRTPWRDHQTRYDRGVHHAGYEMDAVAELAAADEQILALEEQIRHLRRHGCDCLERAVDELERLRGHRESVGSWHDDYRGVKSAGADDREAWREVS